MSAGLLKGVGMSTTYPDAKFLQMHELVTPRPVASVQAFRCRRCRNIATVPKGGSVPVCWGCGQHGGDAAGSAMQTIGRMA